jgi:2-polyprenyl-3-methyl-5-hydroxy-6-metoxy-1,4-benzoquinol methylase
MTEYDEAYRRWLAGQGPRVHDLEWRLANLPWRLRMLLRRFPVRRRRVLDYGCGDGAFAAALARAGASVTAFDVSGAALEQARTFAIHAPGLEIAATEPSPGGFDVVFCTQVLEHVEDDRAFAARVAGQARPGGLVVGTTPVGRAFWDPDHKRSYDEAGLRAVLEPLGALSLTRRYRTPLRNVLPWPQAGAAVFLFEIRRPV